MTWVLIVKTTNGDHEVVIGGNESEAQAALAEAQAQIGKSGGVRLADKLVLKADDITAAQIINRSVL
jgi:hypothetical protein